MDESKVVVAILPTLVPGFSVVDVELFIGEEPAPHPDHILVGGIVNLRLTKCKIKQHRVSKLNHDHNILSCG